MQKLITKFRGNCDTLGLKLSGLYNTSRMSKVRNPRDFTKSELLISNFRSSKIFLFQ